MVKRIFILVLFLAAAGGAYWLLKGESDEAKIRKSFARLCDAASKNSGEGTSAMIIKTQSLSALFDAKCSLEGTKTELDGNYSPEEIASNAAMLRKRAATVKFAIHDLNIKLNLPDNATALFTARVSGESGNAGGRFSESRELNATLRKCDGKWLFTSFKVVDVLEK